MVMAFLTAPPLPFIPAELVGTHLIGVAVCYAGYLKEGARILDPLKNYGRPVADLIGPMPYVFLQTSLDDTAPAGVRNYWKTTYLKELDDGTIRTYLEFCEKIPSPLSAIHIHQLGWHDLERRRRKHRVQQQRGKIRHEHRQRMGGSVLGRDEHRLEPGPLQRHEKVQQRSGLPELPR
jgi:hypothetical protein